MKKIKILILNLFLFSTYALSALVDTVQKFDRISIEQGLSQSSINCMFQDDKGYMWFGTYDGLNRFDGYNFKAFKNIPSDSTSIIHNVIRVIYQDSKGNFWIGTDGGLDKFDRTKNRFEHISLKNNQVDSAFVFRIRDVLEDRFGALWLSTNRGLIEFENDRVKKHFLSNPQDPDSLQAYGLNDLFQDSRGDLWIATWNGGLSKYDRKNERFITFKNDPTDNNSIGGNVIRSICEDREGNLWLALHDTGLDKFNPLTEQFTHYKADPDDPKSISHDNVRFVFVDNKGVLFCGTEGGGLNIYDKKNDSFICYKHSLQVPTSISSDQVRTIYQDKSSVMWLGTRDGISKYSMFKSRFNSVLGDPADKKGLQNGRVRALWVDHNNDVWIGTYGGGVEHYIYQEKRFVQYKHNPQIKASVNSNEVSSILRDSAGQLWIGTGNGLDLFDEKNNRFIHYSSTAQPENVIPRGTVNTLFEDSNKNLWMGAFGGIAYKPEGSKQFVMFKEFNRFFHSGELMHIRKIFEDHEGRMWFGSDGLGLFLYDPKTSTVSQLVHEPDDHSSLSNNSVFDIYETKSGHLWIGTRSSLNLYDEKNNSFVHFHEGDGLPNEVIYGILEDDHQNLWLSTNKGLVKFNPHSKVIKSFTKMDGLQSNEFNIGSRFKAMDGRMYFGGIKGYNYFHPDSVFENNVAPQMVLSDFKIFNKSVNYSEHSECLDAEISNATQINLTYKDKVVTFEFSALSFVAPEKNQYAYIMEGLENQWNYVGNRRIAPYINLPAGEYVFRAKGSNNDGLWNEVGTSINVIVTPPIWQTLGFRVFNTFFVIVIVVVLWRYRIQTVQRRNVQLEAMNKKLNEMIWEQRHAEEKIQQQLYEKEILLKEVHHRVKNNMQVITSLLNLQADFVQDEKALEIMQESQNRVKSMALVHEKLYQTDDLGNIDFGDYSYELANHLLKIYYQRVGRVIFDIKADNVLLGIDTAVPLALIINEIISNSFKHAFPNNQGGTIFIHFHVKQIDKNTKTFLLSIGNDGVPFPKDFDIEKSGTLGMDIIHALALQLDGSIELDREQGARFILEFSVNV